MNPRERRIVRLLSEEPNRQILSVLDEAADPLTVRQLAETLVSEHSSLVDADDFESERDRILVSLHHHRLPKLAEARLLEYYSDERVVAPCDASTDVDWLTDDRLGELLTRLDGSLDVDTGSIGVLEGRESVYEYGRRMAQEAEDELFLIYFSDELLDEGCVPQAQNAMDRGLDFHVGAGSPGVREFFDEHLPEATIWEPQLDLSNDPASYPRVERLIFADRKRIIIGLLDGSEPDRAATETAMVGEGPNNPLVVLARELLGPRLDHLDYQSDQFLNSLPFGS